MVEMTVDGRPVCVPEGTTLLEAIRAAGVELPTLCFHESLPPYGACRLCLAAVVEPRPALVASCAYPVQPGMVVDTKAPQAVGARRLALELLLSRCPQSQVLREMAAREGVTATRFSTPALENVDELCVLCGLCVRVCRDLIGAAALCFAGRGRERRVTTPFDLQSDACIGCGACAEICPTGAIRIEDRGNQRFLHTWHTTVALSACAGCGRFFAPDRVVFVKDLVPEAAQLWELCPDCRRLSTARQWIEQAAAESSATGR